LIQHNSKAKKFVEYAVRSA